MSTPVDITDKSPEEIASISRQINAVSGVDKFTSEELSPYGVIKRERLSEMIGMLAEEDIDTVFIAVCEAMRIRGYQGLDAVRILRELENQAHRSSQ